jgi:hypothetical protein
MRSNVIFFPDYSFGVYHPFNWVDLAHAMASDFSVAWQFLSKRTIVFFCYGSNSTPQWNHFFFVKNAAVCCDNQSQCVIFIEILKGFYRILQQVRELCMTLNNWGQSITGSDQHVLAYAHTYSFNLRNFPISRNPSHLRLQVFQIIW